MWNYRKVIAQKKVDLQAKKMFLPCEVWRNEGAKNFNVLKWKSVSITFVFIIWMDYVQIITSIIIFSSKEGINTSIFMYFLYQWGSEFIWSGNILRPNQTQERCRMTRKPWSQFVLCSFHTVSCLHAECWFFTHLPLLFLCHDSCCLNCFTSLTGRSAYV